MLAITMAGSMWCSVFYLDKLSYHSYAKVKYTISYMHVVDTVLQSQYSTYYFHILLSQRRERKWFANTKYPLHVIKKVYI